jgi:rRNA processing protein Gar1
MGLGDHLICNGLVRNIINPAQNYYMFVKPHNAVSVSQMYKDLKNLNFIECDDAGAINFINNNLSSDQLFLIGFSWEDKSISFERNFYLQHRIPFEKKWTSFYYKRDSHREQELYNTYNINEPYIFVHDDSRFAINEQRLPKGTRVIRPKDGLTKSIFDYSLLIEKAQSVHCIESCFAFMVDMMILNSEFYIHRYARPLIGYDVVDLFGSYKYPKEILI